MPIISDKQAKNIERLINASIHELVFLNHHIGDDDINSAEETLTTVAQNLQTIEETLAKAKKAKEVKP